MNIKGVILFDENKNAQKVSIKKSVKKLALSFNLKLVESNLIIYILALF